MLPSVHVHFQSRKITKVLTVGDLRMHAKDLAPKCVQTAAHLQHPFATQPVSDGNRPEDPSRKMTPTTIL